MEAMKGEVKWTCQGGGEKGKSSCRKAVEEKVEKGVAEVAVLVEEGQHHMHRSPLIHLSYNFKYCLNVQFLTLFYAHLEFKPL